MTNTELYINGVLVDIGRDLNVRLNRQLINPGELNTKDAQYSYSISLPPTAKNNAAFKYSNVEETKDKFNREYAADLIINSVRVFRGSFRMSNIDSKGYKGNLYLPQQKSIKDIFGDLRLNQNPEYRIPFSNFAGSINAYNLSAANGPQIAIFPYVLYGVLPKVPASKNANNFTARTLWDSTVRMGMQDLAPSINPLLMLRHIFQAQGYSLQGNAFDDEKLTRLYMSYKNADEYVQPWNYGQQAKIQVSGKWSSRYNIRLGGEQLERGVNQGEDVTGQVYACDFLDSTNTQLNVLEDTGGNVLYKLINDADNVEWVNGQIRIPTAGFYKVHFKAGLHIYETDAWRVTDESTGVQHIGDTTQNAANDLNYNIYELRVCRDRNNGDFALGSPKLNNEFYYNNQPQNDTFDANNIPKYFPPVDGNGSINFVDLAQDRYHLLGFCFGINSDEGGPGSAQYQNPLDVGTYAAVMPAKPATSWLASENTDKPTRLAISAPGYTKYGRIGDFDNAGDNPDTDIDYSAGPFETGKVLNIHGNPITPSSGGLVARTADYCIQLANGLITYTPGWQVSDYIDVRAWSDLKFSLVAYSKPDAAIVAMFDENLQFIGTLRGGPAVGVTDTYVDEPIVPVAICAYVRLSGLMSSPMDITGTNATAVNIILHRFGILRHYTYTLTTDPGDNYTGVAYVHNGTDIDPIAVVTFVDGVASFNTGFASIPGALNLKLTLYLKTPNFDVNGTMVISKVIEEGSEEVIGWEATNKYKIDLINSPANYAWRGTYEDAGGLSGGHNAQGETSVVVWLEAGELLTIASVSSEGRYRQNGMHSTYGWVTHEVPFYLSVQPFRADEEWLKVSLSGNGTGVMNWNDPINFDVDSIDLVRFLSADVKTDEFIDNFCKAFNLQLSQISAQAFTLDVKQSKSSVSNRYIDLDGVASLADRANTPLGLPSLYKIGFTVDVDEEGYVETLDDGGGAFETGATEENIVEQKSTFSYNWFKNITKVETGGNVILPLPLISKSDVWNPSMSYPDAMRKRYTDQAYRFWYYDGLLNTLGATFSFNGSTLNIAKVTGEIAFLSILDYKNEKYTILDNYFTLLIAGASHYTEVEAYLTPLQYQALDGTIFARFNSDVYYVAELSGYDPAGRNKTKIKLIRKI